MLTSCSSVTLSASRRRSCLLKGIISSCIGPSWVSIATPLLHGCVIQLPRVHRPCLIDASNPNTWECLSASEKMSCMHAHLLVLEGSGQQLHGPPVGGGPKAALPTTWHSRKGAQYRLRGTSASCVGLLQHPSAMAIALTHSRCSGQEQG